jgi:hypothetical protein
MPEKTAFCIRNLRVSDVTEREPWKLDLKLPKFGSASEYKAWTNNVHTDHCAYSLISGLDPARRLNAKTNEPLKVHGFVADYDAAPYTQEEIQHFVTRTRNSAYPASYYNLSYRGGVHAVWFLEEPIVVDPKFLKAFLRHAAKELGLNDLLRGWDREAFADPYKYYQYGRPGTWQHISDKPISYADALLWAYDVSRVGGDFSNRGVEIPLDKVYDALKEKWPSEITFSKAEFSEGMRCNRFWAGAKNMSAAIVRTTGIQAFSGEQPFLTWGELLGPGFVRKFRSEQIGESIKNFYYDGKTFWEKNSQGCFVAQTREDVRLRLKVEYGFSPQVPKGETHSPLDRATHAVVTSKRVATAQPFLYRREELIYKAGSRLPSLNTARVRPLGFSDTGPQEWGENFPFIAELLQTQFGDTQLPYWLAWLHHAYRGAIDGFPRRGHVVFVAGGSNSGKTLVSYRILAPLFGGGADAVNYVVGKGDHHDHMFDVGFWWIDDATVVSSGPTHAKFTAMVKATAANPSFAVNPKFYKTFQTEWLGRLYITLNDDPQSIRMLPDLDCNTKDKVMLFRAEGRMTFPKDTESRIERELPFFARYIYDYDIPRGAVGDTRFGVKPYWHPTLVEIASANSTTAPIVEAIELWRNEFFSEAGGDMEWRGRCAELLNELSNSISPAALRDMSPRNLGWALRNMINNEVPWVRRKSETSKVYIIDSPYKQTPEKGADTDTSPCPSLAQHVTDLAKEAEDNG